MIVSLFNIYYDHMYGSYIKRATVVRKIDSFRNEIHELWVINLMNSLNTPKIKRGSHKLWRKTFFIRVPRDMSIKFYRFPLRERLHECNLNFLLKFSWSLFENHLPLSTIS